MSRLANGAREIDAATALELVRSGAVVLDVRGPDEWAAGHAPGATSLPLRELLGGETFPRDRTIVTVCANGNDSALAAAYLGTRGFGVVSLAGGLNAWAAAGFPVVGNDGAPGRVT